MDTLVSLKDFTFESSSQAPSDVSSALTLMLIDRHGHKQAGYAHRRKSRWDLSSLPDMTSGNILLDGFARHAITSEMTLQNNIDALLGLPKIHGILVERVSRPYLEIAGPMKESLELALMRNFPDPKDYCRAYDEVMFLCSTEYHVFYRLK
jgi:hypothetical protein